MKSAYCLFSTVLIVYTLLLMTTPFAGTVSGSLNLSGASVKPWG
jgi:hypothetical protein